jgi:dolichol-phosphate mannosyltransferase
MAETSNIEISVVSPVYGAPSLIQPLVERLRASLGQITEDYEIVLVFDCSPDDGWSRITEQCRKDPRVKGICLSRNFGQHYAITAGLRSARGRWVVVMDCDLQDRPEEIPPLYAKAQEGYDLVFAQRTIRKDGWIKCLGSRAFYWLFSYLTDTVQDASIANFGIYRASVVEAILSMGDYVRFFPTMVQWVGFRRAKMPIRHDSRQAGDSSYDWRKLFRLAFDSIVAFSDKPLRLTVKLGMGICILTGAVALWYAYLALTGHIVVLGYASLILSIWFLSGVIIFILGIVGMYLGKAFDQGKRRPHYIVREKINVISEPPHEHGD